LEAGLKVVAVEKDEKLAAHLLARFEQEVANNRLQIVAGDILALTPAALGLKDYQIVANLPYYVTGQFLRQWLAAKPQPQQMTLLLQKEVAERLTTLPPKGAGSKLAVAAALYGQPRYLKTVKAGNFSPPPKVDSALVAIEALSRRKLAGQDEEKFFDLIRRGFAQKRKLLKNNLQLESLAPLEICGLTPQARAEELTLDQWLCLNSQLNNN
jgi:16S rRNA (adenine1518-N6/adenine1519-N6)-dimethyltransferase